LCGYMWIVNYVQWIRHDDVGWVFSGTRV
jgi:hypothetical protein